MEYTHFNLPIFFLVKAVFYLSGAFGTLWFITWIWFVNDDPSGQKYMSTTEKNFILTHRKTSKGAIGTKRPPYLKIMLTPSVWVLAFCDFANAFGGYMVIIEGPNFIKNILHKDIVEVCVSNYTILYHKRKNNIIQ